MKNALLFSMFTIISLFASSQTIFKSFNRSEFILNSETQNRIDEGDFMQLKFSKNDTLVFDGRGLTMKQQKEVLYKIKFSKKEITFSIEHYLWSNNFYSFSSSMDGRSYLCTSNDIEKTFVLTEIKKTFKIVKASPLTLVLQ